MESISTLRPTANHRLRTVNQWKPKSRLTVPQPDVYEMWHFASFERSVSQEAYELRFLSGWSGDLLELVPNAGTATSRLKRAEMSEVKWAVGNERTSLNGNEKPAGPQERL